MDDDNFSPSSSFIDVQNSAEEKSSPQVSYKDQRKQYESVKKSFRQSRAHQTQNSETTLKSGMLKFRNRLKTWHKFWTVVQPGKLIIYKENKNDWVGTVMLFGGYVQPRPTIKRGYSFKFYGAAEGHLYATKGHWFVYYMLPTDSCIMRATNEEEGKAWIDAIDQARMAVAASELRRPSTGGDGASPTRDGALVKALDFSTMDDGTPNITPDQITQHNAVPETRYVPSKLQMFSKPGAAIQRMSLEASVMSATWKAFENVKGGSTIPYATVPPSLCSNRSFLDSISDSFAFGYILRDATKYTDPFLRIMEVTKWFLAGLTSRADGARIPLCPVKGEVSRCCFEMWKGPNPISNRTFVVAEQVSASPATSAWCAMNREAGWVAQGNASPEVVLFGNHLVVTSNATVRVILCDHDEEYVVTLPSIALRGLALGRIAKEIVGEASVTCSSSGLSVKMTFPSNNHFEADSVDANLVSGSFAKDGAVDGNFAGNWDHKVIYTPNKGDAVVVFENSDEIRADSAAKCNVSNQDRQAQGSEAGFIDSERIWTTVPSQESIAAAHKQQLLGDPVLFVQEALQTGLWWQYKYLNVAPWNPSDGDYYVTSTDGKVTVLSTDDLKHAMQTVASMPISAVTPQIPSVSVRAKPKSVSKRGSRMSSVGDNGLEELDIVHSLVDQNAMLLRRVEILEARQRHIYKLHIPLLIVLFYVLQELASMMPETLIGSAQDFFGLFSGSS